MKIIDEINHIVNEILNLFENKIIEIKYMENKIEKIIKIKFDKNFIPHSLDLDKIPYPKNFSNNDSILNFLRNNKINKNNYDYYMFEEHNNFIYNPTLNPNQPIKLSFYDNSKLPKLDMNEYNSVIKKLHIQLKYMTI